MKLKKSSRHSKIAGDFGEALVLYWLSKYGFECAHVDHTGIDLIARHPGTGELMGISVKSRTRVRDQEDAPVHIPVDNFAKAEEACKAFGCVPYFAIVADTGPHIFGFLTSLDHLQSLFPTSSKVCAWKMTAPFLRKYAADAKVRSFEFRVTKDRFKDGFRRGNIC